MKRKEKWKYQGSGKEKNKTNSWPCLVFKENGKENICFTFIPLTIWFVASIEGHISNFIIKKVKITQNLSSFSYISMSFGMRVSLVPKPFLQLFYNLFDLWTVELWTYIKYKLIIFFTAYNSPIWQVMVKVVKIECNSKLTLWDDNKMVGPRKNLIAPNQLTFLFSHLTKQEKWLPLSHFLFRFLTFPSFHPPIQT